MSIVLQGSTSGSITLQEPAIAGSNTISLPAATGTMALLQTPSFATTIGVGGATPSTSGAGITFPATQSASTDANTLDDYEEGTWTPTLSFGGGTTGITYSARAGYYRKVGGLVHCQCTMTLSNKGSSTGSAQISGVPFASVNTSTDSRQTSAFYIANVSLSSTDIPMVLVLSESSQKIDLNFRSTRLS